MKSIILCLGEGEEKAIFLDLCNAMLNKEDDTQIKIFGRKGDVIHKNELRPLIQDLIGCPIQTLPMRTNTTSKMENIQLKNLGRERLNI